MNTLPLAARLAGAALVALPLFASPGAAQIAFEVDPRCADSGHCHFSRWEYPVAEENAAFGSAVSTWTSFSAVGRPGADEVVIYRLVDGVWTPSQILQNPNGPGGAFGGSLDMAGGHLIVGSPGDDTLGLNTGAAFIYELNGDTFDLVESLAPPVPTTNSQFGLSVQIDYAYAAVGEPLDMSGGRVHTYRKDAGSWSWLDGVAPAGASLFGASLAMRSNYLFIGDPADDAMANDAGAVHFYTLDAAGMTFREKIHALDPDVNDGFGISVDADGQWLVVGAHADDESVADGGAAYVFRYENAAVYYEEHQKLMACEPLPWSFFGFAVAIDNGRIAVGAHRDQVVGAKTGLVFVYEYDSFFFDTWDLEDELRADDGLADDRFGRAVSVYSNQVLVGASTVSSGNTWTGAAYMFSMTRDATGGGPCPADVQATLGPASGQVSPGAPSGGPWLNVPLLVPGEMSLVSMKNV